MCLVAVVTHLVKMSAPFPYMPETEAEQNISSDSKSTSSHTNFVIPPATELFPDTYDHVIDKTTIFICILSPAHEASEKILSKNADDITKALEKCGYSPHQRIIFSTKKDLDDFLEGVETMDFDDCSAILLCWLGETDTNGSNGMIALNHHILDIRNLWKPFVKVDTLLTKPKINMFFTYVPFDSLQVDSCKMQLKPTDPYEAPHEADVLIIYQKTNLNKQQDKSSSYVVSFGKNMIELGRQYHICNLASIRTITDSSQHHPIIVSTLTRKFFIKPSEHRGIHLELDELTKGILGNLDIVLQGGKRKPFAPRASLPPTPRRQSKEPLHLNINLPDQNTQISNTISIPQTQAKRRPRLPSINNSIESKPKWKH